MRRAPRQPHTSGTRAAGSRWSRSVLVPRLGFSRPRAGTWPARVARRRPGIPQKTRLVAVARVRFAGLYPRKDHFVAAFALHRWLTDAAQSSRRLTMALVGAGTTSSSTSAADLDDKLRAWLQESHDVVGMQSDLTERRLGRAKSRRATIGPGGYRLQSTGTERYIFTAGQNPRRSGRRLRPAAGARRRTIRTRRSARPPSWPTGSSLIRSKASPSCSAARARSWPTTWASARPGRRSSRCATSRQTAPTSSSAPRRSSATGRARSPSPRPTRRRTSSRRARSVPAHPDWVIVNYDILPKHIDALGRGRGPGSSSTRRTT